VNASCGNRPPEGAASRQEPRGRERSEIESQGPRNQGAEGQRGERSAPLLPRRPNLLWRQGAVRLQALRPRDRALLPRNRPQPLEQSREEVARYREAAAGAKSSGSRATTRYRGAHSSARRGGGCIAGLKRRRPGGMVSARDSRHRIAQHGAPRTAMAVAI
jgi:hypothetical protein